MTLQMLRALLTVAMLASGASAQFGAFSWILVSPNGGSGTISGPTMHVEGPGSGSCNNGLTYFETTAPYDGVVRAFLDYTTFDICHYDYPAYVINGAGTSVLPWGSSNNCWLPGVQEIVFEVSAGDTFGLGVGSVDCFEGPGVAEFTAFSLQPPDWSEVGAGLDPRVDRTLSGVAGSDDFGTTMLALGDADGDGVDDVVVGDPFGSSGAVVLRSGTDGSLLWTSASSGFSQGLGLAAPGDVNGDLVPDVAVGHYVESTVRVLSGADGSVLSAWVWGGSALDYYGSSLAAPADLDGDGVTDLAVGTPKAGSFAIRLVSGADGSDIGSIPPGLSDTSFGRSLAALGDLTGDGVGELGFTASAGGTPRVVILSGADLSEVTSFTPPGVQAPVTWSGGVAGVVDRDGDGLRDVMVASPSVTSTAVPPFGTFAQNGLVSFHAGLTGAELGSIAGDVAHGDFGAVAVEGPDVNGDGVPDLAISAPDVPGLNLVEAGRVEVRSGVDGAVLQRIDGAPGERLGTSVAWIGGSGEARLAVGLPGASEPGRVRLFHDLDHPAGAPALIAAGQLVPGEPFVFRVSRGLPNALSGWFLGLSELGVSFKGGVLTPAPDLLLVFALPPSGKLVLAGDWPVGPSLPPSLVLQVWMADGDGPQGFTATPAYRRDG